MIPKKIFVTGIGTNVGKSYATGWYAKTLAESGLRVITQKFVQTGNVGESEDIEIHRRVMNVPMQPCDFERTTAPLILSYPASPHLAARIDKVKLDFSVATKATEKLMADYDCVLIEGAGGIMVPLHGDYLTIDYVSEQRLPVMVVTNGQLGSINHTLLTLEMLKTRGIEVFAVVYNPYFDEDAVICADTVDYIRTYVEQNLAEAKFIVMPDLQES